MIFQIQRRRVTRRYQYQGCKILYGRFANRPSFRADNGLTQRHEDTLETQRSAISIQRETDSKVPAGVLCDMSKRLGGRDARILRCPKMQHRWPGGFFRVDPSSTAAWCILLRSQGTIVCIHPLDASRKNRPRAERRRSFWSFFLGVQEKGRRKMR